MTDYCCVDTCANFSPCSVHQITAPFDVRGAHSIIMGLRLIQNFLSEAQEQELINQIDGLEWSSALARRTQHYGFQFDYRSAQLLPAGPLPTWTSLIFDALRAQGAIDRDPNQLIINEYEAGQGIAAHTDSPCFGEPVISVSLGSPCVMRFFYETKNGKTEDVLLPRRSAVILSGEARHKWMHGIEKKTHDVINGKSIPRSRRISLTFRYVDPFTIVDLQCSGVSGSNCSIGDSPCNSHNRTSDTVRGSSSDRCGNSFETGSFADTRDNAQWHVQFSSSPSSIVPITFVQLAQLFPTLDISYEPNFVPNAQAFVSIFQQQTEGKIVQTTVDTREKYSVCDFPVHPGWTPGTAWHSAHAAEQLLVLRERIAQRAGSSPSYALVNVYRDGRDGIMWHADDAAGVLPQSSVYSISLGCERRFYFRPYIPGHRGRTDAWPLVSGILQSGSLLVMGPQTNEFWCHSLPADETAIPRVNITLRWLTQYDGPSQPIDSSGQNYLRLAEKHKAFSSKNHPVFDWPAFVAFKEQCL